MPTAGAAFQRLVDIMKRLRGPGGCPWDHEQTIQSDNGHFEVADSLTAIAEKLIRRHPHVFAAAEGVDTPGKVVEQWEQIKAREQSDAGRKRALLAGIPKSMP